MSLSVGMNGWCSSTASAVAARSRVAACGGCSAARRAGLAGGAMARTPTMNAASAHSTRYTRRGQDMAQRTAQRSETAEDTGADPMEDPANVQKLEAAKEIAVQLLKGIKQIAMYRHAESKFGEYLEKAH